MKDLAGNEIVEKVVEPVVKPAEEIAEEEKENSKTKASDLIVDLKKRLKALETEKAETEATKLKELNDFKTLYEKDHMELEKTRTNFKNSTLKNSFIVEAQKLGFIDPDLAFRALEDYNELYTVDDNGKIEGLKEVLAKLIKDKPYLVNTKVTPVLPVTSGKVDPTQQRVFTAEEIKTMSYEDKKKFASVIEEQMKKGLIK
jgi:hypothetical protein